MKSYNPSPRLIHTNEYGEPDTKSPARESRNNLQGAIACLREENNCQANARSSLLQRFRRGEEVNQQKRREIGISEIKALERWADSSRMILDSDMFRRTVMSGRPYVGDGSEHTVWGDPQTARVLKLTHGDDFKTGVVGHYANAGDYLIGLACQNRYFHDDIRLEGIVYLDNEFPQLVISQPFIQGREATDKEIKTFFSRQGYQENKPGVWSSIEGSVQTDVWDAVPCNVFTAKLRNGQHLTLTIDVLVSRSRGEF